MSANVAGARTINLNDAGSQISEPERCGRAGEKLTEVDNQNSIERQWFTHGIAPCEPPPCCCKAAGTQPMSRVSCRQCGSDSEVFSRRRPQVGLRFVPSQYVGSRRS